MNLEEYEIMFKVEDRHWWYVGLRNLLNDFLKRHVEVKNPRILDVGCGTGATLYDLRNDYETFGIDLSPCAIDFCRNRGIEGTSVASAMELPFESSTFDVVISMDVLYHKGVPDKRAFLDEIRRVLKPGGVVLLNVPAYQWLYSSHDVHIHTDRRFTRGEILGFLRTSELAPLETTYWNTLLFPPIVAMRLWRKLVSANSSDLDTGSGESLGCVFGLILAFERCIIKVLSLPFGLSIFTVGQKR